MKNKRLKEPESIFIEYFGNSSQVRILDFLIDGIGFDYTLDELARGSKVKWETFVNIWKKLLDKDIVILSRVKRNNKYFTLNRKNEFVKSILKLDLELIKMEME